MGDIFLPDDVRDLFHNKFVVILGDSIQRGVYKDFVCLLQRNSYLHPQDLRSKGERSFMHDELLEGGCLGEMHNGKHYREVRQYQTDNQLLRFYFITRCYSEYMENVLDDFLEEPVPDVVIVNSCIWDLTRYGNGRRNYEENLQRLFHRLSHLLPPSTLLLWLSAMPLGAKVRGGVILEHLRFFEATIRYDVAEANYLAHQVAQDYDVDILDLHYFFRTLTHHRVKDGIHWNHIAHRKMTNMILSHICEAWGRPLPRRWASTERGRCDFRMPAPPVRQPLGASQDNNLSRYGGPINPPGYMPNRPHRHVRSDSCDPSFLFGSSTSGYNMTHRPLLAPPVTLPPPNTMAQNGMLMRALQTLCATQAQYKWEPYQQNNINPMMRMRGHGPNNHPYR